MLFIDLRDTYGMTQVLCDPDSPVFTEVEKVRSEWCIRIDGDVKARDESLINPKIPTGEIEVFIRDLEVLGAADRGGEILDVQHQPTLPSRLTLSRR